MIKRVIFLAALFMLAFTFTVEAQLMHDPNSRLYKDIDIWAVQGYITQTLPMIRPYPLQVIDKLLEEVVENGDDDAVQRALRYRDALLIGEGPRNSGTALYAKEGETGSGVMHIGVTGSVEGRDGDTSILAAPFIDATMRLKDWLTGSLSIYGYASSSVPESGYHNVPGTYTPYPDMITDNANVGDFMILQNWTSALAIGTSELYFQTGLVRTTIGPLYDNGVIAGPQAPRAGHFSVVYRKPTWSFEMLWLELTAADTTGEGRSAGKHLVAHFFNFRPIRALEISVFETVVWGPRIEPLYLLPFNNLFAASSMADFGDNAFLGMLLRWSFAPGFQFLTQLYVDDLHFNDMIRFKFNTKYKVAAELGLVWAPKDSPLRSLALDYTMITPYMYTHIYDLDSANHGKRYPSQGTDVSPVIPPVNYQDYSHAGKNLGPDLEPNSDRISLRSTWKTLPNLDLGFSAYFTRHGNASENRINDGLMDGTYHDGSIFDDGSNDEGNYDNNYRDLRFLTQSVIETKLAGGLSVSWYLPFRFGEFILNAEYTAEYGWNRNLIKGNDKLFNYWSVGGTFRY